MYTLLWYSFKYLEVLCIYHAKEIWNLFHINTMILPSSLYHGTTRALSVRIVQNIVKQFPFYIYLPNFSLGLAFLLLFFKWFGM